ncbi:restriction endonuclease subunit S [Streptococcus australis]|jgi:type Ic restriction-modification system, hsdS subunit|uniref:restriction endonuclease subunit S n=1 Tax=Streptococcus australis TaxID=113107 RepID=UPI0039C06F00
MKNQNRKNPKIRFNRFDSVWEEAKIEDIVKISAGGDVDKERLKESGKYPVIANALTNKGIVGFYDDYKVKAPAVTVTGRGDVGYAVARHENFTPIVRLLTLQSEDIDVDYLENQINSMRILNESTGVPQLTAPQLGNYKVYHPEIDEQSTIGSLFRTLDDLLVSYKDNLANYQSLKATMLSKMFPKAGQTVPEIRLDGFKGEWELLEINYLADDFQSGGTPKTNVQEYWDGDIPWIQSSDLETNCLFEIKVQKSISEKGLKNSSAKIIPKDSIAVVTRVGVGKLAVIRHEYATSQDFLSFSNLKSNIEFTAYLLYRLLQKEVTQLQGTSIKGITKVELLSKKVLIPSLPEQQAIGAYFSNLDNLIASHQEKISQLETLKKKLLQDMFI